MTVVSTGAAAGETEVDSSILDMAGFDSVLFLVLLGTQTGGAVITATAQQNGANQTAGMSAILDALSGNNAAVTFTDVAGNSDNGVLALDLFRPLDRYVRLAVTRSVQNSQILAIVALQYNAKKKPTVQDASILAVAQAVGS